MRLLSQEVRERKGAVAQRCVFERALLLEQLLRTVSWRGGAQSVRPKTQEAQPIHDELPIRAGVRS